MLSYQHIYHAGNFADVHKHFLLVKILSFMKQKYTSLFVHDTHSGRGIYDLQAIEALKTHEADNGIRHIWKKYPLDLKDYMDFIYSLNTESNLRFYPGSSAIAAKILRPQDRLLLSELHPREYKLLKKNMPTHTCLQQDGFDVLLKNVPPLEKNGLIIIDPSYEIKSEYTQVPLYVIKAQKIWNQGCFFIWYPLLKNQNHLEMLTLFRNSDLRHILVSEIKMPRVPKEGFAMYGSGVMMINCPLPEKTVQSYTESVSSCLPEYPQAEVFWLSNKKISPETQLIEVNQPKVL